jgi:mannose-1-phosphate guanylyltransferase/mannose-6-phosphate isomerase
MTAHHDRIQAATPMLIPVILSGGSGTRLWPLSRELYPKQLLPLVSERTMLQDTALRLEGLADMAAAVVVCNEAHRFMVAEQLRQIGREAQAIVLEPVGRNTAPAVAVAAMVAASSGDDPVLLVLPADHLIEDTAAFHAAVHTALDVARQGGLVTFGVAPRGPETGYGYIRRERDRLAGAGAPAYAVAQFVEKPDRARAEQFIAVGDYYWNSGMFMFRAGRYLETLKTFAPDIFAACERAVADAARDLDFTRLSAQAFTACRADSIDYAVMEKTREAVVVPLDAGWSDVGSWSALYAASRPDDNGNVTHGDVIAADTGGCYLHADSRLVAAVGLQDHVVVETRDAVLVAPKSRVQDVKLLVNQLKARGRYETALHREVFRPWGSYDSLDTGERFQVKRLVIKPGAALSLQLHHHRAEHWVVVSGTARITRAEEVFLLEENQSTYIPVGVKHRIENPGMIALHIIEVQSGAYLGEDDIVRFEDQYGRKGTHT